MTKDRSFGSYDPSQSVYMPEQLKPIDQAWENFVLSYRSHASIEDAEWSPFVRASFVVFAHELAANDFLLRLLIKSFEQRIPKAGAFRSVSPYMQVLKDALHCCSHHLRQFWRWWTL